MSILVRLVLAAAAASTTATTVMPSATAASGGSRPGPGDPAAAAVVLEPRMARALDPNPRLAAAASGPAAQSVPLMSGQLLGPAGRPLPDAEVRVDLEPAPAVTAAAAPGVGVALVRLATATTDAQGRFRVDVRPLTDLTGYVDPDGTASLLVTSSSAAGRVLYHVSATPPGRLSQAWTWASPDPDVTGTPPPAQARATLTASGASGASAASRAPAATISGLVLRADGPGAVARAAASTGAASTTGGARALTAAGAQAGDFCPGVTYYWRRYDRTVIKNWNRVQRVYTMGRTQWRYDWSTTASTMIDAAANLGKGGALVSAGLVHVQKSSAGVSFSFGHRVDADAAVQMDNRPYYLYCHDVPSGKTWYSGVYEWRPYKFTGGNAHLAARRPIFRCKPAYRIKIRDPLWVARSSSWTYSAGAKLSTLSVRVKQQNDDYHKLTFVPNPAPAWLCGSNDYPVYARQVKEVAAP